MQLQERSLRTQIYHSRERAVGRAKVWNARAILCSGTHWMLGIIGDPDAAKRLDTRRPPLLQLQPAAPFVSVSSASTMTTLATTTVLSHPLITPRPLSPCVPLTCVVRAIRAARLPVVLSVRIARIVWLRKRGGKPSAYGFLPFSSIHRTFFRVRSPPASFKA